MNLSKAREAYYTSSANLSSVNRSICFAGIAVIWVFSSTDSNGSQVLPAEFLPALVFLVASLAFDFLQYTFAAAFWGAFQRLKERSGVSEEAQFEAPDFINWAALICFWAKILCTAIGYYFLISVLASKIWLVA